jgi:DNA polymerase III subunit delta
MAMPITPDELQRSWRRKDWKPHYLFAGQEDLLIDEAFEQAVHHWLGDSPQTLSLDNLDAETHSAEEILEIAQTVPFFGGARVLRVQNAADLSAKDQEMLAAALPGLSAETHCVFDWGREWRRRDDSQKPLVEALEQCGQVVIFWPLFPDAAQRWVLERARQYQKTVSPEASAWLVQHGGEGLRLLDQELLKCASYVGQRPSIEMEDIQASFGYEKASSPFDWITHIRKRRLSQAIQVLNHLLREGEEPVRLLALLSRSLRDWLSVKDTRESSAILAMRFHVRRGGENEFVQDLSHWSEEALVNSVERCVEAENAIKRGKETPEMALTLLTLGLCRGEMAHASR